MNKWILRFGSLLLAIGLLVGCTSGDDNDGQAVNNNNNQQETNESNSENSQNEDIISITISIDHGEEIVTEKDVPVEDGAILMDVMKENFDIEEDGGFINSIEGIAPEEGEEKAWMYFVNDEMAPVGANEFELSSGDKVVFDLQSWE